MRVALSVDARRGAIEERPDPVAGHGEVLCRVLACGVCGSDVRPRGSRASCRPCSGTSSSREVEAVGAGVTQRRRGRPRRRASPCALRRVPALPARPRDALRAASARPRSTPAASPSSCACPPSWPAELLPIGELDAERAVFVEPLACVLRALDRAGPRAGRQPARRRRGHQRPAGDRRRARARGRRGLGARAARRAPGARARARRRTPPQRARRRRARLHARAGGDRATRSPPSLRADRCASTRRPIRGRRWSSTAGASTPARSTSARRTPPAPATCAQRSTLIAGGRVDPRALVTHRLGLSQTAAALELQRRGEAIKALVLPQD